MLAIVDYGDSKTGKTHLFSFPFYLEATRVDGLEPEVWFAMHADIEGFPPDPHRPMGEVDLTQRPNGEVEFNRIASNAKGVSTSKIIFRSKEEPVVTSYDLTVTMNGKLHSHRKGALTYFPDEKAKLFPKRAERYSQDSAGEINESVCQILSVDPNPQSLEIFSIDAHGVSQTNVWVRRLVIFGVGIALLAIYIAYRRVKNRA